MEPVVSIERSLRLSRNQSLISQHAAEGNRHFQSEDYMTALKAYSMALLEKPDDVDAWYGKARIYVKLMRFDDAANCYEHILALAPDSVELLTSTGVLTKDVYTPYQTVVDDLVLGRKSSADLKVMTRSVVASMYVLRNYPAALWTALQKSNPNVKTYCLKLGLGIDVFIEHKFDNPIALYEHANKLFPKRPNILFTLARLHHQQASYKQALAWCNKTLEVDSDHSGALTLLGKLYCEMGQFKTAGKHYKELEEDVDFLCGTAQLQFEQGNFSDALEGYRHAVEIDFNCLEAIMGMMDCFIITRDYETAILAYNQFRKVNPHNTNLMHILASKFYYSVTKLSFKQQIDEDFNLVGAHSPFAAAQTFVKIRYGEVAADIPIEYVRLTYQNPLHALCESAHQLLLKQEYEQAFSTYHRVLDCNPHHYFALLGLAELHHAVADYTWAILYFLEIGIRYGDDRHHHKLRFGPDSFLAAARLYYFISDNNPEFDFLNAVNLTSASFPSLQNWQKLSITHSDSHGTTIELDDSLNDRNPDRPYYWTSDSIDTLYIVALADMMLSKHEDESEALVDFIEPPLHKSNAAYCVLMQSYFFQRRYTEAFSVMSKMEISDSLRMQYLNPERLFRIINTFLGRFASLSEADESEQQLIQFFKQFCGKHSIELEKLIHYFIIVAMFKLTNLFTDTPLPSEPPSKFSPTRAQVSEFWCSWGDSFAVMEDIEKAHFCYHQAQSIETPFLPDSITNLNYFELTLGHKLNLTSKDDSHAASRMNTSTLLLACQRGDLALLATLDIKAGAELPVLKGGRSAWEYAAEGNQPRVIEWLISKNIKMTTEQARAVYAYSEQHSHFKIALHVIAGLEPQLATFNHDMATLLFEKLICKIRTKANAAEKNLLKEKLLPFLKFALLENPNLKALIKKLNTPDKGDQLIATFEQPQFMTHFLINLIAKKLYTHPSWERFFTSARDETGNNPEIRAFLNQVIDQAFENWYSTLDPQVKKQLAIPTFSVAAPVDLKPQAPVVSANPPTIPPVGIPTQPTPERVFPKMPTQALARLFELTKELDVETVLSNAQKASDQPSEKNSWKDVFLRTVIPDTASAPYDVARANFNSGQVFSLMKTVFFKTNIVRAFGSFLWNRDFSGFKNEALGEWSQDLSAIHLLKEYFNQFYVTRNETTQLDTELLVISLLCDEEFFKFISDESNITYLANLIEKLAIPGLDVETAKKIFALLTNIQKIVQSEQYRGKIKDYASCVQLLGKIDAFIPLAQDLLFIVDKLGSVLKLFIEPHLTSAHLLLFPIVDQVFTDVVQLRATQSELIDMRSLFDKHVPKEKIGLFLLTPTGEKLRSGTLAGLEFVNTHSQDPSASILSFQACKFQNFSFKGCRFQDINFANSYFENCDFTGAVFEGTLDLSSMSLDYETARTLLPALSSPLSQYEFIATRKMVVRPHDQTAKLKVAPRLSTQIEGLDVELIPREPCIPVPVDKMKSEIIEPERAIPGETPEEESAWQFADLFSGIGSYLPSVESVTNAGIHLLSMIETDPVAAVETIASEVEGDHLNDNVHLSEIEQQLQELMSLHQAQVRELQQASNAQSQEVDALRKELEETNGVISSLQSKLQPIREHWQSKLDLQREVAILCSQSSQIKSFYQTFLSQFEGALLGIFVLHNRLSLVEHQNGRVLKLASLGNNKSAKALRAGGLLTKAAAETPALITKAASFLSDISQGAQSLLTQLNALSQVAQTASSAMPIAGAVTTILNKVSEQVVNYYEDRKLIETESFFGGMTTKKLGKLSLDTAGKISLAFADIARKLNSKSAKLLAHYCVKVITVLILNDQFDRNKDFSSQVLIHLRTYTLKRELRDVILREKLFSSKNVELPFTEKIMCENMGICVRDSKVPTHFHRYIAAPKGDSGKSRKVQANQIGFLLIDQTIFEILKKYFQDECNMHVHPESCIADPVTASLMDSTPHFNNPHASQSSSGAEQDEQSPKENDALKKSLADVSAQVKNMKTALVAVGAAVTGAARGSTKSFTPEQQIHRGLTNAVRNHPEVFGKHSMSHHNDAKKPASKDPDINNSNHEPENSAQLN